MSRSKRRRAKKATVAEIVLVLLFFVAVIASMDWWIYAMGYRAGTTAGFSQGVEHVVKQLNDYGVAPVTPQKYVPPIDKGEHI